MTGMDRRAVRDRAPRYNAEGSEGPRDRRRVGRACFPDGERLSVVRGWVEAGPDPARDGVVRWRVRDIRRKIEEAFGAALAPGGVGVATRDGAGWGSANSRLPTMSRS